MNIKDILKPKTIDEAKTLKSTLNNSKYLAGGTDLVINLKKGKIATDVLIDLNAIDELKNITEDNENIIIGSMVTFSTLKDNKSIKDNLPLIYDASNTMGSPQIRNMATIGGNIVNAGAAADIIPCILAVDGILVFESLNNERKISCNNYFKAYSDEKILDDEILTKILIPKGKKLSSFYKLGKRNSLSIARLSVALTLDIKDDIITNLSIALGAVGKYPFRVMSLENASIGKAITWLYTDEPLTILENEVFNSIKERKTMPFKKEAIKGVYKEALRNILNITN